MFSLCPKGLGCGGTAGGAWIGRTRSVGPCGAGRLRRRYRIKPQVLSNPGIHQAGGANRRSQAVREFAGRVSDFRERRVGRLKDGVGHDARRFGRCHHLQGSFGISSVKSFDANYDLQNESCDVACLLQIK
jgi:hypothetical protein